VKKTTIMAIIAIVGVMSFQVLAHPGSMGTPEDPVLIDWVGDISVVEALHNDQDPYKGTFTIYVKNTGTKCWGDFHFKIIDPYPDDCQAIDNVSFIDSGMTDHDGNPGQNPTSSQTLDSTGWTINNTVVGATTDLYFYDDPVKVNETVWFQVYTDNADEIDWFGIYSYPTEIPEPATLALLGFGSFILLRNRKTRKKS